MTLLASCLLLAAGLVAATDWWAVGADRAGVEFVCKPLALVLLIGVALGLHPALAARREWFVAALICCLAGDVLLMLPGDRFVAGLVAFLVGHLAYIAGLTQRGVSWHALAPGGVVVLVAVILATRILPAVARADRSLVAPVVVYMVVISAMAASAAATGSIAATLGAGSFFVSDALLAWNRFVRSWSWARVGVIVTYHLGQAGLVIAIARP